MKIYLASDHAGFALKAELVTFLGEMGHEAIDMGAQTFESEDDYPDFVIPCAEKVASEIDSFGIVIGGSGQGEAMAANRARGARAVVFYGKGIPRAPLDSSGKEIFVDKYVTVRLSRMHNNANILSLGARFLTIEEAKEATRVFIETPFSADERNIRRLNKF